MNGIAGIPVADYEPGTDGWLTLRRSGLGSSDAAAVLGWSPWTSPWQLWALKSGRIEEKDQTEQMSWGQRLEAVVAEAFADRYPYFDLTDPQTTYRHPVHEWMLASPDRIATHPALTGPGVIEIKTVNEYASDEWASGELGEDGIVRGGVAPTHYLAQVQHQHEVLGTTWGYLVALLGGNRLCVVEVPRDDEFAGLLLAAEEGFWRDCVLEDVPPPMDGLDSTTDLLNDLYGEPDPDKTVELAPEVARAVLDYHEAAALLKDAETAKKAAANALREALGDAVAGTVNGVPVVTWKASPRRTISEKRLREEFPEVAAKVEATTHVRTMRPGRSKAALAALEAITDGGPQ